MGMGTVPLSELYAGAEQFLREHGGEVVFNASVEGAVWDKETSQWTLTTRAGEQVADFLVLAVPFEGAAQLLPHMPPADGVGALAYSRGARQGAATSSSSSARRRNSPPSAAKKLLIWQCANLRSSFRRLRRQSWKRLRS